MLTTPSLVCLLEKIWHKVRFLAHQSKRSMYNKLKKCGELTSVTKSKEYNSSDRILEMRIRECV